MQEDARHIDSTRSPQWGGPRAMGKHQRRGSTFMRRLLGALVVVFAAVGVWSASAFAAAPTPPFGQCPAVGADPSCGILIVVNPGGGLTVLKDPAVGPYDGLEDTLVGVLNS